MAEKAAKKEAKKVDKKTKKEAKKVDKKTKKADQKSAKAKTRAEKIVAMDRDGSKEVRRLFNALLTKNKGALILRENAHGAVQIVRDSDRSLMFSMRSDGRLLVTAPISEKQGKKSIRSFKHPGDKWNHMSQVPFKYVTMAMLEARVKDAKTSKQWHDHFYKTKPEASGLIAKATAAQKRLKKVVDDVKKKKSNVVTRRKPAKTVKITKRSPVEAAVESVA